MRLGFLLFVAGCSFTTPKVAPAWRDASHARVLSGTSTCIDLSMSAGSSRDRVYVLIREPGTMEAACAAGGVTRTYTLPSPDVAVERALGRHLIPACSEWDDRERVNGYAMPVSGTVTVQVTPLPGSTYDTPLSTVHVTLDNVQWQARNGALLPLVTPVAWTSTWDEIGYDTGAVTGTGPCTVL